MKSNRAYIFSIRHDILISLLLEPERVKLKPDLFPPDAECYRAWFDPVRGPQGQVCFAIHSNEFPEVPEGEFIPQYPIEIFEEPREIKRMTETKDGIVKSFWTIGRNTRAAEAEAKG